jgi:nucleoside-diphosphate-sugar epimerase
VSKLLITSCNSYIGSYLADYLMERNYKIIGTFRRFNKRVAYLKAKYEKAFEFYKIDLAKLENYNILPNDAEIVVHNAGTYPWYNVTNEDVISCNVNGTQNLVKWVKLNNKIKKVIGISSLSVYGNVTSKVLEESTPLMANDVYGVTKQLSEIILRDQLPQECNKYFIRLPVVLGASSHRAWIPECVKNILQGKNVEIYNKDNMYNSLTTDYALANFIQHLIEGIHKKSEYIFNIGATKPIKIIDIIEKIKLELNSTSKIIEKKKNDITYTLNNTFAEKYGYKCPDVEVAINYYLKCIKDKNNA